MDLVGVLGLLARRKLVVAIMVILTIASLALVYKKAPPVWKASGAVVLVPPENPQTGPGAKPNPYLEYGDLSVVSEVLVRTMESTAVGNQQKASGVVGTVTVTPDTNSSSAPIIDITDQAGTGQDAVQSTITVTNEVGEQLVKLQQAKGVDTRQFITTQTVLAPTKATRVFSSTLRRLIAVGVLDLILIVAVTLAVDTWASRRAERRAAAYEAELNDTDDLVDDEEPEPVSQRVPATQARTDGPGRAASRPGPVVPAGGGRSARRRAGGRVGGAAGPGVTNGEATFNSAPADEDWSGVENPPARPKTRTRSAAGSAAVTSKASDVAADAGESD